MKTYTSTQPYHDGAKYYKPGEVFTADVPKGKKPEAWTEVKPKEAAAIEASTNAVPDDANLEAASKPALEAVAIMRHVNVAGLDKAALITAIKASYEAKL